MLTAPEGDSNAVPYLDLPRFHGLRFDATAGASAPRQATPTQGAFRPYGTLTKGIMPLEPCPTVRRLDAARALPFWTGQQGQAPDTRFPVLPCRANRGLPRYLA